MIDHKDSTAELNLVAIDIAKAWNVVLIREHTDARRRFKVANTRADHDRFVAYLKGLQGTVRVGFEPTGDYHRPLLCRLLTEGFDVRSVSSVALARIREARFGNWDKNDPKDAQVAVSPARVLIAYQIHVPAASAASRRQVLARLCRYYGPEFTSRQFLGWCEEHGIRLLHIQPGRPMQNGRVESFNGRFRDECLNANWFTTLMEAKEEVERWREEHNRERPHSSLAYRTPEEFAKACSELTNRMGKRS